MCPNINRLDLNRFIVQIIATSCITELTPKLHKLTLYINHCVKLTHIRLKGNELFWYIYAEIISLDLVNSH